MSDIDQVHLREIPLFSNLPETELLNLAKNSRKITVKGGKCIYKAGDPVDEISFLLEGNIKICKVSKGGKELTIAILKPGAHIGLVSLLSKAKRDTSAVAISKCKLISFDAKKFTGFLQNNSTLTYRLLESISQRLYETSSHLAENALYDLKQRLALRLFELAELVELDGTDRLLVRQRPSHQELANLLGTSREAITRTLKHLEDTECIEIIEDQILLYSSLPT